MKLNSGRFSENDLVKCYGPPNLRSVMAGNHVMLRSGGPCMIVTEDSDGDDCEVQYENHAGDLITARFLLYCLTCYGAK